jgi:hypothetical protein
MPALAVNEMDGWAVGILKDPICNSETDQPHTKMVIKGGDYHHSKSKGAISRKPSHKSLKNPPGKVSVKGSQGTKKAHEKRREHKTSRETGELP